MWLPGVTLDPLHPLFWPNPERRLRGCLHRLPQQVVLKAHGTEMAYAHLGGYCAVTVGYSCSKPLCPFGLPELCTVPLGVPGIFHSAKHSCHSEVRGNVRTTRETLSFHFNVLFGEVLACRGTEVYIWTMRQCGRRGRGTEGVWQGWSRGRGRGGGELGPIRASKRGKKLSETPTCEPQNALSVVE